MCFSRILYEFNVLCVVSIQSKWKILNCQEQDQNAGQEPPNYEDKYFKTCLSNFFFPYGSFSSKFSLVCEVSQLVIWFRMT